MTTKNELLAQAKTYGIAGRHEMNKAQLESAIAAHEFQLNAENPALTPEEIKAAKRRALSNRPRGADGKVIRSGSNLSGNIPWNRKYYYLNAKTYRAAVASGAIEAAPKQVQGMLRYMFEHKVTGSSSPLLGGEIAEYAINHGFVKSKIAPAELFAYYRRLMDRLGLTLGMTEGEDGEGEFEGEDEEEDAED